jgi:predicted DNA-binding protein with PD1-like motif
MEYEVGRAGKIVVVRLSDGDPMYASIEAAAAKEGIKSAAVWLVGGIKNAGVVVGPKNEDKVPLEVMEKHFADGREIAGVGTIFTNAEGKPKLHMHAAIGKGDEVVAGCPRKGAECWLVDEVIIMEITGLSARRVKEAKCGLELLSIPGPQKK